MGIDPISIGLIASAGLGVLGAQSQAVGAREQAEAEQDEAFRQQVEANREAQAKKSERALAADKEFASMTVAMETIGGAGSLNEAQLGQEIHGTKALDLARIEGNRERQIGALQARAKAAHQQGLATQAGAAFSALGSVVDLGSGLAKRQETKDLRAEEARQRRNPTPFSLKPEFNTSSPLGGASFT